MNGGGSVEGSRYAFGDTASAAERLATLARVFDGSTRAFIRSAGARGVDRVWDLGCGPGRTTRLLLEEARPRTIHGFDSSDAFLEAARQNVPGASFHKLDVSGEAGWPAPAPDLIFCRFLLSHLSRPRELPARWGARLAPAGRLLIEEVEAIETSAAIFRRYLELSEALVEAVGGSLWAGRLTPRAGLGPDLPIVFDRAFRLEVRAADAARMFVLNIPNWRRNPEIERIAAGGELKRLERELGRIAAGEAALEDPVWTLRQSAWLLEGSTPASA